MSRQQRGLLADKLPDAANVALGALVFGQFVGQQPSSVLLFMFGVVIWLIFMCPALLLSLRDDVDDDVRALLILYGPIAVFAYLLILLDWLGRRHDRKSNRQKPA